MVKCSWCKSKNIRFVDYMGWSGYNRYYCNDCKKDFLVKGECIVSRRI